MPAALTCVEMLTCLGNAHATFAALLRGETGVAPPRYVDPARTSVHYGYSIVDGEEEGQFRPTQWLTRCLAGLASRGGLRGVAGRVSVIVGTGLRELRSLERWHADGAAATLSEMHFASAVRAVLPQAAEVYTVSNACAASGYALGLGADLLELGEADAVVVAGTDTVTESMLAMIGRVGAEPSEQVRPFDVHRRGVLLGEGAVAVVLRRCTDVPAGAALATIRGIGMTCDAFHETAPDAEGVARAMRDAHDRAGIRPEEVGLVVAHGTSTALNDPTEATAMAKVFAGSAPMVTAIKGAIGHTSGGAALMSLVTAVQALQAGRVPPIVGLRTPIPEAAPLRLVIGEPAPTHARVAQINAFGFGGVNAVAVVEVPPR